jgi:hypothetical protein
MAKRENRWLSFWVLIGVVTAMIVIRLIAP